MEKAIENVRKVMGSEAEAIQYAIEHMELATLVVAANMLHSCLGMAYVSGCGTSGAAARKIVHMLNCVERPAAFISPADAGHGGMGAVCEGDVVVLLSNGGETAEILAMAEMSKQRGAFVIAVTQNEQSTLAQRSDLLIQLVVRQEADPCNVLATSSIMVTLAVFDAITVLLMELGGFTRVGFGQIHPQGAVGNQLRREGKTDL